MKNTTHSLRPDDLSHNAAWIRALARRLVRDDAAAEDLVQETWLAALQQNPARDRSLKPWLGRVLRNLAAKRRAREAVRGAVELGEVAGDGASPDQTAETLEQQRVLIELVQELPEPQRTTLVLRYTHGHTAAEIARRQDVPAGTVRWRLKQAVDHLREELDERNGGDRRSWTAALLPLFRREELAAEAASATAIPVVGAAVAAGLLALVSVFVARELLFDSVEGAGETPALVRAEPLEPARETFVPPGIQRDGRTGAAVDAGRRALGGDEAGGVAVPRTTANLSGTLRDQDGRPLGPALLMLDDQIENNEIETEVDDDGRWSLSGVPPSKYLIGAEELPEGYLTAWHQWSEPVSKDLAPGVELSPSGPVPTPEYGGTEVFVEAGVDRDDVDLTVYLESTVEGRVVDATGAGVAGAAIQLRGHERVYTSMRRDGETDANGEFEVAGLWPGSYDVLVTPPPAVGSSRLHQQEFPVVGLAAGTHEWVEVTLGGGSKVVRGRVLDDEARPFAGLRVFYATAGGVVKPAATVTTDEEGRFEFVGVLEGSYRLHVGLDSYSPNAHAGSNKLAESARPVSFQLQGDENIVDLGDVRVKRSKPFVLRVSVDRSPGAPGMRVEIRDVVCRAAGHRPHESVRRDSDGRFVWWCETPHEPVEFVLLDLSGVHEPRIERIRPERDVERDLTLTFP